MSDALHMLALRVPAHAAMEISDILEAADEIPALAVSQVEVDGGAAWRIEAIYETPPDRGWIQTLLAPVYQRLDLGAPELLIDAIPDKDWVVVSLQVLAPVRGGFFTVHGSHDRDRIQPGRWTLEIEASRAFGTGHHETTRGCLIALSRLAHRLRPKRIFDLGCGTAVLAMAAARLWNAEIVAGDIDPLAVKIAAETVRKNRLGRRVRLVTAAGFGRTRGRYDLVLANVLVNPLTELAPQFRLRLQPGGYAILSGILNRQAINLENCYHAQGFITIFRLKLGEWTTLVLRWGHA